MWCWRVWIWVLQRTHAVLTEQAGSERRAAAYDKGVWKSKSAKEMLGLAEAEATKLKLNPSQVRCGTLNHPAGRLLGVGVRVERA